MTVDNNVDNSNVIIEFSIETIAKKKKDQQSFLFNIRFRFWPEQYTNQTYQMNKHTYSTILQ